MQYQSCHCAKKKLDFVPAALHNVGTHVIALWFSGAHFDALVPESGSELPEDVRAVTDGFFSTHIFLLASQHWDRLGPGYRSANLYKLLGWGGYKSRAAGPPSRSKSEA